MNLWRLLFPVEMLSEITLWWLPFIVIAIFVMLLIVAIVAPNYRPRLLSFIIASCLLSAFTLLSLSPGMSTFLLPSGFIILCVLSLVWFSRSIFKRERKSIALYLTTSLVALLHTASWSAWVVALSNS